MIVCEVVGQETCGCEDDIEEETGEGHQSVDHVGDEDPLVRCVLALFMSSSHRLPSFGGQQSHQTIQSVQSVNQTLVNM